MQRVKISSVDELDGGWLLTVKLTDSEHEVGVSRDYYQQLTDGDEPVESLVERSFRFLLEREPASSIMSRFELSIIQNYFPEYESEISLASD